MNFIRMKLDTHYFLQDYEICETRREISSKFRSNRLCILLASAAPPPLSRAAAPISGATSPGSPADAARRRGSSAPTRPPLQCGPLPRLLPSSAASPSRLLSSGAAAPADPPCWGAEWVPLAPRILTGLFSLAETSPPTTNRPVKLAGYKGRR